MKAIVNTGAKRVEWKELPKPEPGPNQVRIRTAFCGICATDLEMISGWERTGCPSVPGHEWSGVVDAVGDGVDKSLTGSACVADNILSDGGEVGFEHPGGYGEYFLTEAKNIRLLPEKFPLDAAALIEPLAVCARGMKRLGLMGRRSTLIIGDGPLGLLFISLLKLENVQNIVCAGGRPARLQMALSLGADRIVNYHDDADDVVSKALGKASFQTVIEASGTASGMKTALYCAAGRGKILVIGDYGANRADFPWNILLHNELELIGSNAGTDAWDEAISLAVSCKVPLKQLISASFPAYDFTSALRTASESREAVKIMLDWRI
jgi:(R,R)-butanediol dehydrogenase / meso-butanediol dehydrogenase / diacetyl reductase